MALMAYLYSIRNPLLEEQLLESLRRLNPTLPVSALEDVVKALRQIEGSSLYERNFKFTQLMQNGVEVSYADRQHQVKTSVADLIDFEHPLGAKGVENGGRAGGLFQQLLAADFAQQGFVLQGKGGSEGAELDEFE